MGLLDAFDSTWLRAAFDRRMSAVTECVQLDVPYYDPVITRVDDHTAILRTPDWTLVAAVTSAVVADTSVVALPDAERIASEMSRLITERIA